ncbi:hypothetical protein Taro_038078 [Colocasia esculenta]|uniref:Secreted protein n=1 Tax=Colocasia esculenta TaxID=4460 RepID=A0A843WMM4_COLES|nr:hypothetical protein [Colocasia esculenta]
MMPFTFRWGLVALLGLFLRLTPFPFRCFAVGSRCEEPGSSGAGPALLFGTLCVPVARMGCCVPVPGMFSQTMV